MIKYWLLFSFLLHAIFTGFLFLKSKARAEKSQEIRQLSEKEFKALVKNYPQIVQTDSKFNSKKAPKTGYLAKNNQTTDKNQVAAKSGEFINAEGDFGSAPKSITKQGKFIDDKKGKGVSATDDYLAGATIGPITILNTQEFKYFNYYDRIRKLVVEKWRPLIRKAIKQVKYNEKKFGKLEVGLKVTKLAVTLNEKGEILKIDIVGTSGLEPFDNSGIKAFKQSEPFASPPKELVKNGTFLIRWDFAVLVEAAGLVELKAGQVQ